MWKYKLGFSGQFVQFKKNLFLILYIFWKSFLPLEYFIYKERKAKIFTLNNFNHFSLFLSLFKWIIASVSVRNIRNIPKVPLTVKPDPNDTLNRSLNQVNGGIYSYYGEHQPMQQVNQAIYMNGVGGNQPISPEMQHQYAVVNKGSKRDINNLERENPAIFKVTLKNYRIYFSIITTRTPYTFYLSLHLNFCCWKFSHQRFSPYVIWFYKSTQSPFTTFFLLRGSDWA